MSIKRIIKNIPLCNYLIYCVKGIMNIELRKKIIQSIENSQNLNIICLGKENSGKVIYYIRLTAKSGFCVLYKNTLELIYFADRLGFIPVVEFTSGTLYSEKKFFRGTNNAFEYYFEQPGTVSLSLALKSENVIFSKSADFEKYAGDMGYNLNEYQLRELAKIQKKYIFIKDDLKREFDKEIMMLFDHASVLGVHVRDTDFKNNYKNHPVYVNAYTYLQKVDELWATGKFNKIFLATDSEKSLQIFKTKFGKNLIYFPDIFRSPDNNAVHLIKHSRKNDRYLLGKEILKDVFALSKCDALVAGRSNVSMIARIINYASEKEYITCHIIDHGLNRTGKFLKF